MTAFWKIFESLKPPRSSGEVIAFSVHQPDNYSNCYVACSMDGLPTVLIELEDTFGTCIELENLSVLFGTKCRVKIKDQEREKLLTIIQCRSTDILVQQYFMQTCEQILHGLGAGLDQKAVVEAINHLTTLFRKLSAPPTKELNGLVGELLVILFSSRPERAVQSWHTDQYERFDFSSGIARLEVKASASRQRQHNFSYEQCLRYPGMETIIASLFVERVAGGTKLESILSEIESKLTSLAAVKKLRTLTAEILGSTLMHSLNACFDIQLARSSLQFYNVDNVPAIRSRVPAGVSSIRFSSDLSLCPPIAQAEMASLNEEMKDMLPQ